MATIEQLKARIDAIEDLNAVAEKLEYYGSNPLKYLYDLADAEDEATIELWEEAAKDKYVGALKPELKKYDLVAAVEYADEKFISKEYARELEAHFHELIKENQSYKKNENQEHIDLMPYIDNRIKEVEKNALSLAENKDHFDYSSVIENSSQEIKKELLNQVNLSSESLKKEISSEVESSFNLVKEEIKSIYKTIELLSDQKIDLYSSDISRLQSSIDALSQAFNFLESQMIDSGLFYQVATLVHSVNNSLNDLTGIVLSTRNGMDACLDKIDSIRVEGNIASIENDSGDVWKYNFSSLPVSFSEISIGDRIYIAGASNSGNNGIFDILEKDNTGNGFIKVNNPSGVADATSSASYKIQYKLKTIFSSNF